MNKANRIYIDKALVNTNYRLYGWKSIYNEVTDLNKRLRELRDINFINSLTFKDFRIISKFYQ